jgi:hypothetical protein
MTDQYERLRQYIGKASFASESDRHSSLECAAKMRGLLLWALYHHQGGSSTIGLPIRAALGIGEYSRMTPGQIEEAQRAGGVLPKAVADSEHGAPRPLDAWRGYGQ